MIHLLYIKLRVLIAIIRFFSNWPTVIADHLHFLREPLVVYKLRSGIKIVIRTYDTDRMIVDTILLGEYFYPGFEIRSEDVVIDIGAHIGAFTLYAAAQARKGTVLCFEPSSENFELLQQNIKLNGFKNIRAEKLAIFNKNGATRLYLSESSRSHFNVFNTSLKYEDVETITLEEVFQRYRVQLCHLLKLDCEGAEYEILLSTPPAILKQIERIVFEYHTRISTTGKLSEILSYLKQEGFTVLQQKETDKTFGTVFAINRSLRKGVIDEEKRIL